MRYIKDENLFNFKAWSGGAETLKDLKQLCRAKGNWDEIDQLDEYIEEAFEEVPTDTQVNDFLWFERDLIAELLGYANYDEILNELK